MTGNTLISQVIGKDNEKGAVGKLLELNQGLREAAWPFPFNETKHVLKKGDARDLSWIPSRSIHLIVTSPPYWTLKQYEPHKPNVSQLGDIESYELFLEGIL